MGNAPFLSKWSFDEFDYGQELNAAHEETAQVERNGERAEAYRDLVHSHVLLCIAYKALVEVGTSRSLRFGAVCGSGPRLFSPQRHWARFLQKEERQEGHQYGQQTTKCLNCL